MPEREPRAKLIERLKAIWDKREIAHIPHRDRKQPALGLEKISYEHIGFLLRWWSHVDRWWDAYDPPAFREDPPQGLKGMFQVAAKEAIVTRRSKFPAPAL